MGMVILDKVTVRQLLQQGSSRLTHSPTATLDCELLLASALEKSRTWLHTWPDHSVDTDAVVRYRATLARRIEGEPIAYICGTQSFWSLEIEVSQETLIPRPETELVVERALELIPRNGPFQVVDLGTGSGAIALAVATDRPQASVVATDLSTTALKMAQRNVDQLGIRNVTLLQGEWFAPLGSQRFDLILSNPPYIAPDDPHLQQGDLRFEPANALVAAADGLAALRSIITTAPGYLNPGGSLVVEHGYHQGNAVRSLFQRQGFREITTRRDLAGEERITFGINPQPPQEAKPQP